MLVSRIQCNRLQFRDTHLVETNHDELEDVVGNLYSTSSDLNIDITNAEGILIEGLDESPEYNRQIDVKEVIKPIKLADTTQEEPTIIRLAKEDQIINEKQEESDKENSTTEIWRPPTPPKISPKIKEKKVEFNQMEDKEIEERSYKQKESSPSKTPSPPQLASVDVSLWKIQNLGDNVHANHAPEIPTKHAQLQSALQTNLNETFDLPGMEVDPSLKNECDTDTNVGSSCEEKFEPILDTSYTLKSENETEHSNLNGSYERPLCTNSSPMDVTITINETNKTELGIDHIPSVSATSNECSSQIRDISPSLTHCETYQHNDGNYKEERNDLSISPDKNDLRNASSTEKISNESSDSVVSNKALKRMVSERRGTFTIGNGEMNSSPIVAVVPPNTRRDINNDLQNDKTLGNQSQNSGYSTASVEASTVSHSTLTEISPNPCANKENIAFTQENTPARINTPPAVSSAGGGKRTLKRSGTNSSGATSASTSKLLKGLSAYRPLNRPKVPNVGNSVTKTNVTQQVPAINVPSYMASTASSSRRLNFAAPNIDSLNTKANTNTKSNGANSPRGIQGNNATKENDEPNILPPNRSKDNFG